MSRAAFFPVQNGKRSTALATALLGMDNFSKHKHWRASPAIIAPKTAANGDLRFLVRYFTNWFNSNIGNNTASTIASTTTPINKIIAGSIIAASAAMRISISRCC